MKYKFKVFCHEFDLYNSINCDGMDYSPKQVDSKQHKICDENLWIIRPVYNFL